MAVLTIGGESFAVRKLTLGDLRAVAPAFDAITAAFKDEGDTLQKTVAVADHMLAIFAQGLDGISAEDLAAKADMTDIGGFWRTLIEVQQEAGMLRKGEVQGAAETEAVPPAVPSKSRSTTSSRNSSPPAAATGTA